jgi:phospholipase/carboxylesterase
MPENPLHALSVSRAGPSPRSAGAATVLLHGRGRTVREMLDLAEKLALPGMPFVAVPAAEGTWYPESFLVPRERNEPRLGWALERLEAVVRELEEGGLARQHIALVGFSQGACLASDYLFRTPLRWGALAALTGGLIGPPGTTWIPTGSLAGTPVLLATSDIDELVPLARVEETAEVFRSMGAAVDLRVYAGRSHLVSDAEILATRSLLSSLLEQVNRR